MVNNLIIYYSNFFVNLSFIESARQLEHETNLDVSKFDVCDNVDLSTILQEYEFVQKNKRIF
jgi:katanin p60 ATPase-containing subunit A1